MMQQGNSNSHISPKISSERNENNIAKIARSGLIVWSARDFVWDETCGTILPSTCVFISVHVYPHSSRDFKKLHFSCTRTLLKYKNKLNKC